MYECVCGGKWYAPGAYYSIGSLQQMLVNEWVDAVHHNLLPCSLCDAFSVTTLGLSTALINLFSTDAMKRGCKVDMPCDASVVTAISNKSGHDIFFLEWSIVDAKQKDSYRFKGAFHRFHIWSSVSSSWGVQYCTACENSCIKSSLVLGKALYSLRE